MAFAGPNPIAALLAARAAGGAAPAAVSPAVGAAARPPIATPGPNTSALVAQAANLLTHAQGVEKDPVEREALSKIVALLHGFAAREQKQRDAAMGAGPAVQMLRRTQG